MANNRVRQTIVAGLLLSLCCFAVAQVYKTTDENGRVIYTNTPGDKKAEKVDISEPNTMEPVRPRAPLSGGQKPSADIPTSYEVTITAPANETHLNPGQWDLTVQVSTTPNLHSSHHIQITDNGAVINSEGTSAIIANIVRGTHALRAEVLDGTGRVIGSSPVVTVYVHRPTVAK